MKKTILITGGCGFIGHHFVEHFIKETDWDIIVLDKLNYASNGFDRLRDIDVFDDKRVHTFAVDLNQPLSEGVKQEIGDVDYIVNLASESHVDNSIAHPVPFIKNNINLMLNMLEYTRESKGLKKFVQFSCYDKETRVLTKNGLKSFNELKIGDIVFTLNEKTRKVEEHPIKKIIISDYDGKMIKLENGRIDMLVTPNHRMYNDKMEVCEARQIKKRFRFPQPTGFVGKKEYSKELMYLIGIFLGDGFTTYQEKKTRNKSGLSKEQRNVIARDKKGRFTSGRFGDKKWVIQRSYRIFFDIPEGDKARKKTERALTNLGIKFTKQKGKAGEHLYFTSEKWVKFFSQFGKGAKNKFIPEQFLKQDSELLKELFRGLIDSDGYWGKTGGITFTTVSEKLKDNICEIAVKIGMLPQVSKVFSKGIFKKENRVISGWAYQVCFSKRNKSIDAYQKGKIEKIDYKGKIWSIRVKNENFLVERNGKFIFSGNTDEVFGTAPEGVNYKEGSRHNPGNPYSASKAAQEDICRAYANTYRLPIIITNCWDMKTRVMTNHGPRKYDEIKKGDLVWTLDDDENLVLTPVLERIKMKSNGEMINIKNYQLVTPNHRVFCKKSKGKPRRWGKLQEIHADKLLKLKGRIRIPLTGRWRGNEDSYPKGYDKDWLARVIGWYVSKGFELDGNGIAFGAGSENQFIELESLLSDYNPHRNGRSVRIYDKKLKRILQKCGKYAEHKIIPDFILDGSISLLRAFWSAAMAGDGSIRKNKDGSYQYRVYYTKSEKLAWQMAEVGMKMGYGVRVTKRYTRNPSKTKKGKSYIVRFRGPNTDIERKNVRKIKYNGNVWSIRVKEGRVFVERNGIVSFSGQTMNVIGERQHPEKFVPMCIRKILKGETVTIHSDPTRTRAGSRFYIHARNAAKAIHFLLETDEKLDKTDASKGQFNIVGEKEIDNLSLAKFIAKVIGKELKYKMVDFHSSRPGHDLRYALDGTKLKKMGFEYPKTLEESLTKTIKWYLEDKNKRWLNL